MTPHSDLRPHVGAIARCASGRIGLITRERTRKSQTVWMGLCISPENGGIVGFPWESVKPEVIATSATEWIAETAIAQLIACAPADYIRSPARDPTPFRERIEVTEFRIFVPVIARMSLDELSYRVTQIHLRAGTEIRDACVAESTRIREAYDRLHPDHWNYEDRALIEKTTHAALVRFGNVWERRDGATERDLRAVRILDRHGLIARIARDHQD